VPLAVAGSLTLYPKGGGNHFMTSKLSLEEIREFWTNQAVLHRQSPAASWSDVSIIHLEIKEILGHLEDGDNVLDVGCANGYSTVHFAAQKRIKIRGLDFVPEMVREANLRLEQLPEHLRERVNFKVGDITSLEEPDASYDKVVVIRVLINLQDQPRQQRALQECVRVLKPGGVLLLSEATLQGWQKLNRFRREWLLPDIPEPSFNKYIDEDQLIRALTSDLEIRTVVNFASTYYVLTRLIKPLLIQAIGKKIDVADPSMEWNRWAAQLPSWGDYGTQKLFVLQKGF